MVAADPGLVVVPMWWSAGRLVYKNPSDAAIVKMCEVAKVLEARVQGDDGEYYDA
ncbi:hypothetical protein ACQ4WX_03045 [Streptomyces lasalocidi]|uniref:hypothetical protein n=1 Tax=Streptomyces sp. MUSC 14 TaxID=1354889 RepID=UPI001C4304EE|nr:hypothetical protein [Streptomyces sp. MUSC 14]